MRSISLRVVLACVLMSVFCVPLTSVAQSIQCAFPEYNMTFETGRQGGGSDYCSFNGAIGDAITIRCVGCFDLDVESPDGELFAAPGNPFSQERTLEMVLPQTGAYWIYYSWDFGSRQDYVIDEETGFGENITILNEGLLTIRLSVSGSVDGGAAPAAAVEAVEVDLNAITAGSANPMDVDTLVYAATRVGNEPPYVLYRVSAFASDLSDAIQLTSSQFYAHEPDISADGRLIVFVRGVDANNSDLWIVTADGSELAPLTQFAGFDLRPNWSPDGTRVAYQTRLASETDWAIFVVDLREPYDPQPIYQLSDARNPTWSPDGQRIAFTAYSEFSDSYDLFIASADGMMGGLQRLTDTPGIDEHRPEWSPDGRWIAYNTVMEEFEEFSEIKIVDVASQESTSIQQASTPKSFAGPKWSPDSLTVIFHVYDAETEYRTVLATDLSGNILLQVSDTFRSSNIDGISWYGG